MFNLPVHMYMHAQAVHLGNKSRKSIKNTMSSMYVGLPAPTNVKATVIAPNSVEVTWDQSSDVIGYLISCTTSASYAGGKNKMVNDGDTTSYTLTDLVENTLYDITVQCISRDDKKSLCSNEVSVKTSTAGK